MKRTNIIVKIYSIIFEVLHEMWKERCDHRHKRCNGRTSATMLHLLDSEVCELYALKASVLSEDWVALRDNIDNHLSDSV